MQSVNFAEVRENRGPNLAVAVVFQSRKHVLRATDVTDGVGVPQLGKPVGTCVIAFVPRAFEVVWSSKDKRVCTFPMHLVDGISKHRQVTR